MSLLGLPVPPVSRLLLPPLPPPRSPSLPLSLDRLPRQTCVFRKELLSAKLAWWGLYSM